MSTSVAQKLDATLFPVVPAKRLAALRILVGSFVLIYVVARVAHLLSYGSFSASDFRPVGIVSLLDAPLPTWAAQLSTLLTLLLALPFALGYRYRVTAPLFALFLLWSLSYRNSWGMIFHTENLFVLHVIILAAAPAAETWSLDSRARRHPKDPDDSARYGWAIQLMCWVTVIAYLLAGIAKVRIGGWSWAEGEVLRNYIATDNLRKLLLGDTYSPVAVPALAFDSIFYLLGVMTFVLELGAPIALFGRKLAITWALAIWGFHMGVLVLMAIVFPYPISGIAFASFIEAERPVAWIGNKLGNRLRLDRGT